MPRMTVPRFPRLAALLAAAALGLVLAAGASADTPPGRGPTGGPSPTPSPIPGDCAVLLVQLNGERPATRSCLAHAPAGQGTDPSTSAGSTPECGTHTVQLFQYTNYGGQRICFEGDGIANLNEYYYRPVWWSNWTFTWSDALSSFKTGASYVNFYEHFSGGGEKLRYARFQSRASMPSGWDNRVSSLCIWGYSNTCP